MAFVEQQIVARLSLSAKPRELAKLIRQKFDVNIHPRTIERAAAGKKRRDETSAKDDSAERSIVVTQYETLRRAALGERAAAV